MLQFINCDQKKSAKRKHSFFLIIVNASFRTTLSKLVENVSYSALEKTSFFYIFHISLEVMHC